MVRNLPRRKWLRWCHVLLLHELGAVQDNNVWHRRKLRREPILPCAIDTAAAPFGGEATPSPARLGGLSPRGEGQYRPSRNNTWALSSRRLPGRCPIKALLASRDGGDIIVLHDEGSQGSGPSAAVAPGVICVLIA